MDPCTHPPPHSVPDAGQIVGELLDDVGGHAGLHRLGVVGDEDGLDGLDDDDAFLALLPVQTPLLGFDHHVPLARDPQPVALDLLHRVGVIVCGHNLLDLGGGDLRVAEVSMITSPLPDFVHMFPQRS